MKPTDRIAIEIPTSQEMLTPKFLSHVLQAEVRSVTILDNHVGNGKTGSLVQLALDGGLESSALPKTMIAKFSSFDDRIRKACNALGFYEREIHFYNEMAGKIDFRTPHCYYAAFDPHLERSLLLLEDLSGYQMESWPKGCSIPRAKQAIREMARLHAAWWNRPELNDIAWLFQIPAGIDVEFAKLWDGFRDCMQLGNFPEIMRIGEIVQQAVNGVVNELEEAPITLIHNDYHLNNLAFGSREVVVLDWAMPMAAKGTVDLTFFLVSNLSPADRRSAEKELMHEYLRALAQAGVEGYTLEQCFQDYKKAMLMHFSRKVLAISAIEITEGSAGKRIQPHALRFWTPIVERYLFAIQEHYLMR